jgi:hypothetical protein
MLLYRLWLLSLLDVLDNKKHHSLFFHNVNDEEKSFMTLTLGRFINGKPSGAFWYDFR